jgi:hypothetical protein
MREWCPPDRPSHYYAFRDEMGKHTINLTSEIANKLLEMEERWKLHGRKIRVTVTLLDEKVPMPDPDQDLR